MSDLNRRLMLAGAAASVPAIAHAQAPKALLGTPLSVITSPARDFGPNAPPPASPDPDIIRADPSFGGLLIGQETIRRVSTGYHFLEGPAWSAVGLYAVFSDVKNDTLYRYLWETGQVSVMHRPSFSTNGNSFDFQGRMLSTQDYFRRVVRWELDGSMSIVADSFEGKPLNSPNDLAPHKDGSVWFTDPQYGGNLAEGHPDDGDGVRDPRLGNTGVGIQKAGGMHQELPMNVYRADPSGRVEIAVPFEPGKAPNGICFSPDYTKVYIIRAGGISVGDVNGAKVTNLRVFTDAMVDGVRCGPDGMRADRAGNIWASSAAPLGYCGVTVWNPAGKLLGRIRLPEGCANLCFAGPKRDHLFMTATQSVYMLRVNIQGAAPG
ncbi:MAG: SMP-30/gluconolactonase/LRE family protein [Alphaproteobacteria bacterium]|nr:SMP-30/gluconolactonase/LRE family protein [Alphaproteobacteria bacterium]